MGKLNVDVFSDLKDIFQISGNILGVIVYGKDKNKSAKLDLPYQYVQMQNVEKNIYEVWFTDETVEYKQYGNCVEGKSLHYCFRAVEENDSEGEHSENAEKAYRNILQEFDFNVFRVVRFWNYIPGINEYGEYDEHYKEFCVGRERAFYNFYKENGEVYPAATGIGSNGKDLCIVLLAVHIDASRYKYIHEYVKNKEYMIVGTERRHGFSQNDVDRQWHQIVDKIRKKQVDGVIVANMSVITDNLIDAFIKVAQVQAAGGIIVTVDDGRLAMQLRGF